MIDAQDAVRLKEPLQIEAGTKGRVCGVNEKLDKPLLVAIWVRLGDEEVEIVKPKESEAV